MPRKRQSFASMHINFCKTIAEWPHIPRNNYALVEQICNDFNSIVVLAARRPIFCEHQLGILQAAARHLLKYENEGLPEGVEDAMDVVIADAIENAESPLHAALLALVRHRAQLADPAL